MSDWVLLAAVFLASAVEAVEALTIVLASGITRGWRSTFEGVGAALLALAALVAVFGPAIARFVPIDVLRVVVGGLLLVFGLQWLRKAILRATGYKALHDEDAIFEREVARLSAVPASGSGRDATAFTVSFKGVFLEGMEVVIIVVTLGAPSGRLGVAALGAGAAVLLVALVGLAVHRRLSEVPENAMKMGVGLMLTSFGTFWAAEGVGVAWPGNDLAILGLLGVYALATLVTVAAMRRGRLATVEEAA